MNKKNLKQNLNYSFSNDDIHKYLNNINIIEYKNLANFKSIDDLISNDKGAIVILLETDKNTGHWISLAKDKSKNLLIYFDSYGLGPDKELKFITKLKRKLLGEDRKLLTFLIDNSNYDCIYNNIQLQSHKNFSSTCGRHNIYWLLNFFNNKTLQEYINLLNFIVHNNDLEYSKDLKYDIVMLNQVPIPN